MPNWRKASCPAKAMDNPSPSVSNPLRFPLFLDLTQKRAVVIGGGKIAARRVFALLEFVREITVIAPELLPELEALALENRIEVRKREFQQDDLLGADLAITATGVKAVDDLVWQICREKHIPVNVSADQTKCDFFFPGIARHNNLVAGITACGTDHRLAKRAAEAVRDLFETIE